MELFIVLFRTLFFYFFIILAYRIMGKREIGQLGIIDLIVSILIAELVAMSIENNQESMFLTIIPIILLVILEIIFAYVGIKSSKFRTFFDGKPSLIITEGKVNYHEMIKQRYSLDDLLITLRQNSIKSIEEVEYAILEPNGKLSIFKYDSNNRRKYPMPLILDGKLNKTTLKQIKKNESWLRIELENLDLEVKDVFYAFYNSNKIYIIKRDSL